MDCKEDCEEVNFEESGDDGASCKRVCVEEAEGAAVMNDPMVWGLVAEVLVAEGDCVALTRLRCCSRGVRVGVDSVLCVKRKITRNLGTLHPVRYVQVRPVDTLLFVLTRAKPSEALMLHCSAPVLVESRLHMFTRERSRGSGVRVSTEMAYAMGYCGRACDAFAVSDSYTYDVCRSMFAGMCAPGSFATPLVVEKIAQARSNLVDRHCSHDSTASDDYARRFGVDSAVSVYSKQPPTPGYSASWQCEDALRFVIGLSVDASPSENDRLAEFLESTVCPSNSIGDVIANIAQFRPNLAVRLLRKHPGEVSALSRVDLPSSVLVEFMDATVFHSWLNPPALDAAALRCAQPQFLVLNGPTYYCVDKDWSPVLIPPAIVSREDCCTLQTDTKARLVKLNASRMAIIAASLIASNAPGALGAPSAWFTHVFNRLVHPAVLSGAAKTVARMYVAEGDTKLAEFKSGFAALVATFSSP